MRFIGVVDSYTSPSIRMVRDGEWIRNGERELTELTGPFYAFEMPWGRDPCQFYPEGLDREILHLRTHDLHLLCELEDEDTVEMTENRANVHEPKWTLRMAGDDDDSESE